MLSLICNRASICKQSVKALMGISTEFYSDKNDINFIDVNAKSLWPFSTFVNQVLKFYPHFACSERLRKFPIKYVDLYICGRGVRKLPVKYWHRNHCCIWLLHADSEGPDQTGWMHRLIWVFAGRTCHFVGFVMLRLSWCRTWCLVCFCVGQYEEFSCIGFFSGNCLAIHFTKSFKF